MNHIPMCDLCITETVRNHAGNWCTKCWAIHNSNVDKHHHVGCPDAPMEG